jgi:hypothetical protein
MPLIRIGRRTSRTPRARLSRRESSPRWPGLALVDSFGVPGALRMHHSREQLSKGLMRLPDRPGGRALFGLANDCPSSSRAFAVVPDDVIGLFQHPLRRRGSQIRNEVPPLVASLDSPR